MTVKKIAELEAGDKVINHMSWYYKRVLTVEAITPSGLIRTDGGLFRRDGYARGAGRTDYIIPATDELIKKVEDEELVRRTLNLMWDCREISVNAAEQIVAILEGDKRCHELMR